MNEGAENEQATNNAQAVSSTGIWDLLESFVLFAGLPALTLYPVGVCLYWVQFTQSYNIDLDSALYPILLIPREYVLGQVIRAFIAVAFEPFLLSIIVPIALGSFVFSTLGWRGLWGSGWKTTPVRRLVTLLGSSIVGLFFVPILIVGVMESFSLIIGFAILFVGTFLGGYVLAKDRIKNKNAPDLVPAPLSVRRWPITAVCSAVEPHHNERTRAHPIGLLGKEHALTVLMGQ